MKRLNKYIQEKLIINKNYKYDKPESFDELRKIIENRYDKLGPGTKNEPIDFNDIDVSDVDSFCNNIGQGVFEGTKFKYIDISKWDVSNVENMNCMFIDCKKLKSVGDLSNWNVSKIKSTSFMFYECRNLKSVGDLSDWNISNVEDMSYMFCDCEQLKSVGDLSKWKVLKFKNTHYMFAYSGITKTPDWYKK